MGNSSGTTEPKINKTSLERYYEMGGDKGESPLERLRFFCSLAMNDQDWADVEGFFDDIIANNG